MSRLVPLFSGSKGNCYCVQSGGSAILIDAGRSAKQIENALKDNDIDSKTIQGIFVTHEHCDHVSGLRVFASRYGINVYATAGTLECLAKSDVLNDKYTAYEMTGSVQTAGGMNISCFATSHDCRQGCGYVIEMPGGEKLAFATDTGYLSDNMLAAIKGSNVVVLESNHDVNMLLNGEYPYPLKRRILSDIGHLSNETCANVLPFLIQNGTTRIMLAHLSEHNNMPSIAKQCSLVTLTENKMEENKDFTLQVARPVTDGRLVAF